jgi:hypothetical protein
MTERDEFRNYFNYFTEVEEHFQRARGTGLFLMSPLDWALVESWKNSGVPLQAVLRGIDAAFDMWRSRKSRTQMVNSVAFCGQAIAVEAEAIANAGSTVDARKTAPAPFPLEDVQRHLDATSAAYLAAGHDEVAATLGRLAADAEAQYAGLEGLEQRLTALEDTVLARLRAGQSGEEALDARKRLDAQLKPYRSKMTAAQLSMLERQYLDRELLERARLPRLSLFYMR